MSLLEMQYDLRPAEFEASRVTIWRDPMRRDEIYLELQTLEEEIFKRNIQKPVVAGPFARMGPTEPLSKAVLDELALLYKKLHALRKELDSLIDAEASRRESAKLREKYLGIAEM
jgi:hypothetical protein